MTSAFWDGVDILRVQDMNSNLEIPFPPLAARQKNDSGFLQCRLKIDLVILEFTNRMFWQFCQTV